MKKQALVLFDNIPCGYLSSLDNHFEFSYLDSYLDREGSLPVSLSLPLSKETYSSLTLFAFFEG